MPKGVFERPKARGRVIHGSTALSPGSDGIVPLPPALEEACRNFESAAGGREALVSHLAHAPLTEDQQLLLGAIADPRNDPKSLARICYTYGIQFADLLTLFRAAGFAKAQLGAMQQVWDKLPDVAGDVMGRSVPHMVTCPACGGRGETTRTKVRKGPLAQGQKRKEEVTLSCGPCAGTGEVLRQPKLETQKVALELGGLLQQKGPGVEVNVLQQQALAPAGSHAQFYRASDAALFPGEAIEVEAQPIFQEEEAEVGELVEDEEP